VDRLKITTDGDAIFRWNAQTDAEARKFIVRAILSFGIKLTNENKDQRLLDREQVVNGIRKNTFGNTEHIPCFIECFIE
jgi:hypothetical protein